MRQIAWISLVGYLLACGGCGKPNALWGNATTGVSSQGNHFAYWVHGDANGKPIACVMERFTGTQPPNAIKWSSETRKDGSHNFTVNGTVITPVPDKVLVFVANSKGVVVQIAVPLSAATHLENSGSQTPDDLENFWSNNVAPKILPSQLDGAVVSHSPVTVLGGFHDMANKTITFSTHHLRVKGAIQLITEEDVYLIINGEKYPINSSDTMRCDSHTGAYNVISEYIIRDYKVLSETKEIPGLRSAKSVIFGLSYKVNGRLVKIEQEVPIINAPAKA